MSRNLELLKEQNLIEKMNEEAPEKSVFQDSYFHATETFVWSEKHHFCIPIKSISIVHTSATRYLNSIKGNAGLRVTTTDGRSFDLLFFNGNPGDHTLAVIRETAEWLKDLNPNIVIK